MMKNNKAIDAPDRVSSYFRRERFPLIIVSVTGVIYNAGMTAGPWFEGKLAQTLCDIIGGSKQLADMVSLAVCYAAVIFAVQALRCAKRFYVRRFANDVSRSMKGVLYRNLVHISAPDMACESMGGLMTKAVSDVDACAEGMRKFTTEVFDTGVVMVAYLAMMVAYDWRLTLIACLFPPFAYLIAGRLKKTVSRCAAEYKESAGRLNDETLDRVSGALTYRVLGSEPARGVAYNDRLADYEKKAVRSGILETCPAPLYQIISNVSVIFIIYFGAKNVGGSGWQEWDIAAFATFLSCFAKLAVKSSKAAKLFNAVQKASVSWARIKPLMKQIPPDKQEQAVQPAELKVKDLSFSYPQGGRVIEGASFTAAPGQIIGVTGPVACGKSTLGKVFLCEQPYEGSILLGDEEIGEMSRERLCGAVAYQGHAPELMSDTIEENVLLGDEGDASQFIKAVCMDGEVAQMPYGVLTKVGAGGVRLSGGQQARLALARTLCHGNPLIILDDPFAALDRATEQAVAANIKELARNSVVILISHRLFLFEQLDKVLWMEGGRVTESTHEELMRSNAQYRELYDIQAGGEPSEQ